MDAFDELWPGGPRFKQNSDGFPLSTDSVLLAHFAAARARRPRRVIDLGCGAGVLTVLLRTAFPEAAVEGIELQARVAALCRENLAANGFSPDGIRTGDLREPRPEQPAGAYDLAVSNPPYFPAGSGYAAPDPARAAARDERKCTLDQLCAAAARLCRWGGAFALVHRPEHLSRLCCALTAHGLEPKRLRFVQHRAGKAPSLVLVEARRGGNPGLAVEPPLLLCDENGRDTPEVLAIYHRV